jgi:signal peptidase I
MTDRRTTKPKPPGPGPFESLRETLEHVAIAFVLAFVFRAFVVEAFVIPTGSMAPSLYGAHVDYTCSDCGYSFAFSRPRSGYEPVCPNCGYRLVREQAPFVDPGDRILVLKWPFDVGRIWGPRRWDVTVFKNPADGRENYIKRLVGLPGEVLEIIDGDLYIAKAEDLPDDLLDALSAGEAYDDLTSAQRAALDEALTVEQKTPAAQAALWHLVFNQDYLPARRLGPSTELSATPAWLPAEQDSPWQDNLQRVIRFDRLDGQKFSELVFRGIQITDFYAYNGESDRDDEVLVSDNRLRFVLEPIEASGLFRMQLCKRDAIIRATLDSAGQAWLTRRYRNSDAEEELARAVTRPWRRGRMMEIDFAVVDGHARLLVDGKVVFGEPVPLSPLTAGGIRPLLANGNYREPPPDVRLAAAGARLCLHHLLLQRDVYYRSERRNDLQSLQGTTGHPIYLRPAAGRRHPGDYFMLGDNSPQSKDSRMWTREEVGPHLSMLRDDYQVGTVPGDQLIGRAFFVYWPAGIRPLGRTIPIIPNVGRMRFIH